VVAPTETEYLPASQPEQVSTVVAPTAAEYLPAVQLVQAEAPVNAMYVPAGHNKQVVSDADVAPVCPYFPAEHRVPEHVEFTVAPTAAEYVPDSQSLLTVEAVPSAYLPAPHEVHAADPGTVLNLPAAHAVHAPPPGPVWPASHTLHPRFASSYRHWSVCTSSVCLLPAYQPQRAWWHGHPAIQSGIRSIAALESPANISSTDNCRSHLR